MSNQMYAKRSKIRENHCTSGAEEKKRTKIDVFSWALFQLKTRGMHPIVIFDVFLRAMTNKRKLSFDVDELELKFGDAIVSYEQSSNIVSVQFWRLCSISN